MAWEQSSVIAVAEEENSRGRSLQVAANPSGQICVPLQTQSSSRPPCDVALRPHPGNEFTSSSNPGQAERVRQSVRPDAGSTAHPSRAETPPVLIRPASSADALPPGPPGPEFATAALGPQNTPLQSSAANGGRSLSPEQSNANSAHDATIEDRNSITTTDWTPHLCIQRT
jgi:hypothetical protein